MLGHDNLVDHLWQRLHLHCMVWRSLQWLTVWNAVWGTLILVLRSAFGLTGPSWHWGVAVGLVTVLLALLFQLRRPVAREEILTWLDDKYRLGGLLIAGCEASSGAWIKTLPQIDLPGIRWRRSRTIGAFLAASFFVVLAFSVPQRYAGFSTYHTLELEDQMARLQDKLQTLAEQQVITEEKAEDLQHRLEQIMRDSSGEDPGQTLEALDHIEDMLQKTANKAAEQAINRAESLARARELALGLMDESGQFSFEERQRMQEELEKALGLASSSFPANTGRNYENALELPGASNSVSIPEAWSDLVSEIGDNQEELQKFLEKMSKQGLTEPKILEELLKAGKIKKIDLSTLLQGDWDEHATPTELIMLPVVGNQHGAGADSSAGGGEGSSDDSGDGGGTGSSTGGSSGDGGGTGSSDDSGTGGSSGAGGVGRGPGYAPLNLVGTPPPTDGAKFTDELLPQTSIQALEDSKVIGVGISAPTVTTTKISGNAQTLRNTTTKSSAAHSRGILPRYQPTLKRYFQRRIEGR